MPTDHLLLSVCSKQTETNDVVLVTKAFYWPEAGRGRTINIICREIESPLGDHTAGRFYVNLINTKHETSDIRNIER